ncbi:MAG: lipoprotein [Burkholderiaceae bacterium]
MLRSMMAILALVLTLSGCGLKGPLYLPPPPPAAMTPAPADTPVMTPAAPAAEPAPPPVEKK